jgi:Uma2 family endonuclease
VRLPKGDEADERVDTVVQPDVLIVCDSSRIDRRGVRGAPTFVLEVLSPSSARHDQIRKRAVYERAGVAEFWILHPVDGVLTIYRRGPAGTFAPPEIVESSGRIELSSVPGRRRRLHRAVSGGGRRLRSRAALRARMPRSASLRRRRSA